MKRHLIRPSKRKAQAQVKPSHTDREIRGASFPLADYLIPATDAMGRTAPITLSLAPSMHRLAAVIREKNSLPFETIADVLRWAIHHGLGVLAKHVEDEDITSEWSLVVGWTRTAAQQSELAFYGRHLERILKTAEDLARQGHAGKARTLGETVWRESDQLEDAYWRRMYRDRAKRALERIKRIEKSLSNGHRPSSSRDDDEDGE